MSDPKSEVDQKRDEALRRMLNTPRKPHEPMKPKTKKKAKGASEK